MKVQIAEAGAFGPLVKVLGEGTPRAKEGAAGALWRLVAMMNESNIEVNISTKKASDLVVLLHTSSPEGGGCREGPFGFKPMVQKGLKAYSKEVQWELKLIPKINTLNLVPYVMKVGGLNSIPSNWPELVVRF
jgi:hypothetical protein